MSDGQPEPLEHAIGRLVVGLRGATADGAPLDPAVGEVLEALTAIRLARDRLEARLGALEGRLGHLPAVLVALEPRIKVLEARRAGIEARLDRLEERRDKTQARIAALEAPALAPGPWWARLWPRPARRTRGLPRRRG